MSKKWNYCLNCKHLDLCIAGQARTKGVNETSPNYQDIGCFDNEQYIKQTEPKQLKLV